jgi:N-acyl-L-homoserine lactone synthetase
MRNIMFDFLGQHQHGEAFRDYLRLRKRFFVDVLRWDIPHNEEVEMDQYDNPCAHYSLALEGGRVVGGARIMPTSARWGRHTYMLRDALRGDLEHIPPAAMPEDIACDAVWECTRLVLSDTLTNHESRATCLSLVVDGLLEIAQIHGAQELISLSPLPLMRTLRQAGFLARRRGEPYASETDGRRYAVLAMPVTQPAVAFAAE